MCALDTVNTVVLKDAQDKNISYTLEYDTSQTSLDGTVYADTYTFRFKDKTLKTGEACSINIPGTVTSYSQIAVKPVKYQTRNIGDITLSVPENIQTACGGLTHFDLKLNGEAGSKVDNLTPEIMSSFEEFLQIVRNPQIRAAAPEIDFEFEEFSANSYLSLVDEYLYWNKVPGDILLRLKKAAEDALAYARENKNFRQNEETLLGTLHTIQGYLGEISISEMLDTYVNWLNGADPTQYD